MDTILNLDGNNSIEFSSQSMMSFKDCPNHCIDGIIIDPYQHKKIPCPHCAEKRKQLVKDGIAERSTSKTIEEYLNLPLISAMGGFNFNRETVIPEVFKQYLIEDSVVKILDIMQGLIEGVVNCIIPSYSMVFNLGYKSCQLNFIYPYLINAYIAGLSVVPYLNIVDIHNIRHGNLPKEETYNCTFNDIVTRDVFVARIDSGCDRDDVNSIKGIMQLRADNGKSTVILTEIYNSLLNFLTVDEDDGKFLNLATIYNVKYNDKGKKKVNSIKGLSSQVTEMSSADFAKMFDPNAPKKLS